MNKPIRLDLEITRKCKYKCGVCSVRANSFIDKKEISLKILQNKVKEFSELGGREVSITGGEPSERGIDFLVDLIKFSKNLDLKVRMYCVGYGFQKFEDVSMLKEAGLDSVIITLAGPPEVDELYKGVKGSNRIAINAIELFRKNKIQVTVHFTPTKLTYKHLPHVIDMAHQLGVEKIRIMSFVPQGRGWDNRHIFEMGHSEKESFNEILKNVKSNGVDLQFSGVFDEDEASESSCMIAKNRFVVTSDGLLIPTFAVRMDKEKDYPLQQFVLGNAENTMLSNAWNSCLLTNARSSCTCGVCDHCKK